MTPSALRVAAGVLHYRAWPEVRGTIDKLLAQTRPPDEVVVVDHASGDGSAEQIRAAYPQVRVVELPDNRGPAGGLESLLEALLARPVEAVLMLTDDLELAPDALEQLAARLEEEPALGAVGPLMCHKREPELVFYAGGVVDPRTWDLNNREQPTRIADWRGKPPQQSDFLSGSGLLVRAEAAREAGPIPGHFYKELDDVYFTLRLGSHGWALECVPGAVAWMDFGDRSREPLMVAPPPYLAVRNRLGVIARNAPRRMLIRELLRVIRWVVRDAIRPRTGSRAHLRPTLRGLIDFCLGRWGPPPAQR